MDVEVLGCEGVHGIKLGHYSDGGRYLLGKVVNPRVP
jgi:hypothetical protein